MREMLLLFRFRSKARRKAMEWVRDEWEKYADAKMASMDLHDDKWMIESGISPNGDWYRQVTQYFDRAHSLGLDSLQGRQALLKSITTLVDCAASAIRVYGEPPLPGYPSGEIHTRRDGCPSHK